MLECAAAVVTAGVIVIVLPVACFPALDDILDPMEKLYVPLVDLPVGAVGGDLGGVVLGLEDSYAANQGAGDWDIRAAGSPAVTGELAA